MHIYSAKVLQDATWDVRYGMRFTKSGTFHLGRASLDVHFSGRLGTRFTEKWDVQGAGNRRGGTRVHDYSAKVQRT